MEAVASSIEAAIRKIASITFLEYTFQHQKTKKKYLPVYNRYIITNEIGFLSANTQPMIPYGYLINLAVKQPATSDSVLTTISKRKLLNDIIHKASLLAAVSDVRNMVSGNVIFNPRKHHQYL